MVYYSYKHWKALGYHVVKGQHSHKRDKTGLPLFSKDQVQVNKVFYPSGHYHDYDMEADAEQADFYGIGGWGSND
jgi:hypothetical protein